MEDSQPDSKVFSIRIVSIDYYMAPPIPDLDISYSSFQGGKVNEVPVIRIYGSTPAGQKTCLHIHRALPYLYIPCAGLLIQPDQDGAACTNLISLSVEKALKLKGKAGLKRQHVHGCSIVRARKFYGYHSLEELFAKIYLYYPHDVSRAANLLLGGEVAERSLQPHESHIPFLLQFLVDYNLYGMGHLHVSKMKFRHPVPNAFVQRKDSYNGHEPGPDNPTYMSSDSDRDAALHSPIWISSTIPDGWMWDFPSQPSSSSFQDVHLVKRQSTCELEGDAAVDEILNQQFKMYSSLSQTCSDVKMVQSLIPIWEEEYERTGMHEAALLSDPGKPLPEDVLRTFSHGLEFENKLMELCNEPEDDSSRIPFEKDARYAEPMRPSTNEENKVELGLCDPEKEGIEALKSLQIGNEEVMMLLQGSPCEDDNVIIPGKEKPLCPIQLPVDDIQPPRTIGSSNVKVVEKEALGLLSWLASSQGAEDINSDDELARETILTPLLPATTIDKLLDKAHMDFESESQQECQDILDSVEYSNKFEHLKEGSSSADHNNYSKQSSEKTIPQVDGSADDRKSLIHIAGKSSEIEIEYEIERSPRDNVQKETGSSFTHKSLRRKPLWGSLPFIPKVTDDLEPFSISYTEDMKGKFTSSKAGNEADKDVYDLQEESILVGCSVRDLMRRKRCRRFEPPEYESRRVASVEEEEHYLKHLDVGTMQNNGQDKTPQEFTNSKLSPTPEVATVHDVSLCKAILKLSPCGDACDVKPTYPNYFLHGKQSLSFTSDSFLRSNKSKHGYLCSHEGLDDGVTTQPRAGSGNFTTSLPSKSLKFLNSANQNFEISVCSCKNDTLEESECVDFMEPVTSEVCIGRPDSCVEMQNLDADDKLFNDERLKLRDSADASCLSASPLWTEILGVDDCVDENGHEGQTFRQKLSKMSSANIGGMEATTSSTVLHFENCNSGQYGKAPDLSGVISSVSSAINFVENPMELIGVTFCKKPPVVDWAVGTLESTSLSLNIPRHISLDGGGSYGGISAHRKLVDEFLPFFRRDCLKGGVIQKKSSCNSDVDHHKRVIGVPTHHQNDGSYLYMLTPVFSPPSADSVFRWQLHDDLVGDSGKNCNAASAEPSSPKGYSGSQISSQASLVDSSEKLSPEFGSVYVKPRILGHLKQQTHSDLNAAINPVGKEVTGKQQTDGDLNAVYKTECNTTKGKENSDCLLDISQISGPDGKSKPTPVSQIGFRDPASFGGGQQLTLLSIEVQAESRGELRPDPRLDAINVIVLAFQEDNDSRLDVFVLLRSNAEHDQSNLEGISDCKVLASSEEKLFSHYVNIISSIDPDILMGWDIQGGSLGYLAERAMYLGISLLNGISRTPTKTKVAARESGVFERGILDNLLPEPLFSDSIQREDQIIDDEWGRTHASGLHVGGRVVLNIWRLMRGELKLNMYTVEAVAEAVLRRKVPSIQCKVLTRWFSSGPGRARYRCIEYVVDRAKLNLEIMNQLDMINRTSELARVFGIDFFSVLSRGSQYRVESMLLRLARTQNYVAISPGNQQVFISFLSAAAC